MHCLHSALCARKSDGGIDANVGEHDAVEVHALPILQPAGEAEIHLGGVALGPDDAAVAPDGAHGIRQHCRRLGLARLQAIRQRAQSGAPLRVVITLAGDRAAIEAPIRAANLGPVTIVPVADVLK